MLAIVRDLRDAYEFIRAKKRKREPIRFTAHGVAEAIYQPRDAAGFRRLVGALRDSHDFGQATERLYALADALRRRHACGLPTPRKMRQNSDRSLSVWWEGAMVRLFPHGAMTLIGGHDGIKHRGVPCELLDLLAFQARIQCPPN